MTEWYSHMAAINEAIAETRSGLAGLVVTHVAVKAFLSGTVQYLELVKHRALAEGNTTTAEGVDLALANLKQLASDLKSKHKETDDE
jgi:hypothetical protein